MEKLFEYSQLNDKAKAMALKTFITAEIEAIKKMIIKRKSLNIHERVNKSSIHSIVRQINKIKNWEINSEILERDITGNLCNFTDEGFYYLFTEKRFVDYFKLM